MEGSQKMSGDSDSQATVGNSPSIKHTCLFLEFLGSDGRVGDRLLAASVLPDTGNDITGFLEVYVSPEIQEVDPATLALKEISPKCTLPLYWR